MFEGKLIRKNTYIIYRHPSDLQAIPVIFFKESICSEIFGTNRKLGLAVVTNFVVVAFALTKKQ